MTNLLNLTSYYHKHYEVMIPNVLEVVVVDNRCMTEKKFVKKKLSKNEHLIKNNNKDKKKHSYPHRLDKTIFNDALQEIY